MMDADLEKRISDAILDGSEEISSDLATALEQEGEAATSFYAEWKAMEGRLRSWGYEQPPREYWRNFTPRVTGRLGSLDAPDFDVLDPPWPDDPEPEPEPSDEEREEAALAGLAGLVGAGNVPPVSSFEETPTEAVADDVAPSDSAIDMGAIRESLAPSAPEVKEEEEEEEKAAGAAAPASKPKGESAAPPATATAVAAEKEEPKSSSMTYVVIALVLALGVAGYFAFARNGGDGDGTEVASAASSAVVDPPGSVAEPSGGATDDLGAESGEVPDPGASADSSGDDTDTGSEAGEGDDAASEPAATAPRRGSARPRRPGGGGAARPAAGGSGTEAPTKAAPAETPPPAAPAAPAAPAKAEKSGSESLDDLLSGATKRKAGGAAKAGGADVEAAVGGGGSDPAVPEQPSRSQVRRAMGSVAGQVYACRGMVESTVRVNATVTVSSAGAVTSARAAGGPAPVNSCVERAVRGARFPRFSNPTFTVTYPFVLSPPEE